MKPENFEFLIGFLKETSGLVLTKEKGYLIENRLMPIVRKRMISGLDDLVVAVRAGSDKDLIKEVTEAMTTNESFFFRDNTPFQQFREIVLPRFIESRAARMALRIWCAAASTGQEPYTLAMILREEAAKLSGWRLEIVATDLSTEALDRARAGVYTQFEVQRGLPIQYLVKYFQQKDSHWEIKDSVKSLVKFRPFNLLDEPSVIGPCDIVFCRNVLIYFDHETKGQVLAKIRRLLPADGVLYLGGAETVLGISDHFKPIQGLNGAYAVTELARNETPSGGLVSAAGAAGAAPVAASN